MLIEITATAVSYAQAEALLAAGVDNLYFGSRQFGIHLGNDFSEKEQAELIRLIHSYGKKAIIAANGLLHPAQMAKLPEYLKFLAAEKADAVVFGDPGAVYSLRRAAPALPFFYDGETLITNPHQIDFWKKQGAAGVFLARELPKDELFAIAEAATIPAWLLVFGATAINHSKRHLLRNYFQFVEKSEDTEQKRGWFLAEPEDAATHYSIYEDEQGSYVFADKDINLLPKLPELFAGGLNHWFLDGLYYPAEDFTAICGIFTAVKQHLEEHSLTKAVLHEAEEALQQRIPQGRTTDLGFYALDPKEIR
ncbi:MAG: U32 family peptidase [Enterococcaceae bacterium]|nr:U32 family peptidase [Enterococcaceae bacterium]MCI1920279.1 U32 family peptidase [Enterococcaceae bacterium]